MKDTTSRVGLRRGLVVALTSLVFLAAGAPAPSPSPAPAPPSLPELNEKVVAFARSKLGSRVGDGSCTTLAIKALQAAGARYYPMAEADGDFIWGQPIESFKEALPGDILQFRNAVFQGKKTLPRRRWMSWHHEYPHHTAIVAQVSEGGKVVVVLHQNVSAPGQDEKAPKNVLEGTLLMDSLQKGGWVRIYRPVPFSTPVRFFPRRPDRSNESEDVPAPAPSPSTDPSASPGSRSSPDP
jgi:hypothetical protein